MSFSGIFLTDLIAIDEGNPDKTALGQINFNKFNLIANLFDCIRRFQSICYPFTAHTEMHDFWKNMDVPQYEEKDLYEQSYSLESR